MKALHLPFFFILLGAAMMVYANDKMEIPQPEQEDDSFSAAFGFYVQTDRADHSGGNPKLDEDEFVFEGIFLLDKTLAERDHLNVKVVGDIISSASESRLHNPQFRALQANPSGNRRISADIGYSHDFDALSFGGHAGYSLENNYYMSWIYGLNFSVPLIGDNTILATGIDGATDYFEIKLFDGTEHGFTTRQSVSWNGNIIQVISPLDLLKVGLDYVYQFGTLESTFYSVFLNNVEQSEKMPPMRHRGAFSSRWKHSVSETKTFEVGYRLYLDTWQIFSHTIDARFFQYFFNKHFLVEPNIRLHTQTSAFFFEREFTTLPTFRTSDTDLGSFAGILFGLKLSLLTPEGWPWWFDNISLGGNYWLRTDGFQVFWFDLGFGSRF